MNCVMQRLPPRGGLKPDDAIVANVLLLIPGASGVGKSTVRAVLAPKLAPQVESVELTDLASLPIARTLGWRQQTAETAVRRAAHLQACGRHLLLAGDPVAAIEVMAAPSAPALDAAAVCLLNASAEAQAARLAARGDDPTLLVHHQAFAEWMRRQASNPLHMPHVVADHGWEQMRWKRLEHLADSWGMHTIDTSHLSGAQVVDYALAWCTPGAGHSLQNELGQALGATRSS